MLFYFFLFPTSNEKLRDARLIRTMIRQQFLTAIFSKNIQVRVGYCRELVSIFVAKNNRSTSATLALVWVSLITVVCYLLWLQEQLPL